MNKGRTKETRGAYHPETPAPGNLPPYCENIPRGHDPGRSRRTKPHRSRTANRRRTEENRGGIDPGPEPFDLPAVTTQIFSRRLRTRDEHRRTGTTNHRGTTGEPRATGQALAAIHAEDVTQKGNKAARRTTEEQRERGGKHWTTRTGGEPAQKVLNFSHARARYRKSRGSLPGLSP